MKFLYENEKIKFHETRHIVTCVKICKLVSFSARLSSVRRPSKVVFRAHQNNCAFKYALTRGYDTCLIRVAFRSWMWWLFFLCMLLGEPSIFQEEFQGSYRSNLLNLQGLSLPHKQSIIFHGNFRTLRALFLFLSLSSYNRNHNFSDRWKFIFSSFFYVQFSSWFLLLIKIGFYM